MVGFTVSLESIYNYSLFFVNNKVVYIHTLQTMHLPLPSHLSSLLSFLKNKTKKKKKKKQEQVTKKNSTYKDGTLKNQPN